MTARRQHEPHEPDRERHAEHPTQIALDHEETEAERSEHTTRCGDADRAEPLRHDDGERRPDR